MAKNGIGTFLLGRVIKFGILDKDKLIEALSNSKGIKTPKFKWLITDTFHQEKGDFEYFFGILSKYSPEGETQVIDEKSKKTVEDITTNLAIASSPFVFIPEFSGIGYLRIWNQIDDETFKGRLSDLVNDYFQNFFVGLEINDITENIKFADQLKEFEQINRIECEIFQPNPLYGDIWKHLKEYLIDRNSKELTIIEECKSQGGIKSNLNGESNSKLTLTDAAVYMSMDGYGKGKIKGIVQGKEKEIRTTGNPLFFKCEKTIHHKDLADILYKELKEINVKRKLNH